MQKTELEAMIQKIVGEAIGTYRQPNPDGAVLNAPGTQSIPGTMAAHGLSYHYESPTCIRTKQGSLIDLTRKTAPFVELSSEVAEWGKAMREYLKSRGSIVSRLLSEGSDPSGGYLVPEEVAATLVQYDTEPACLWPYATIWPMTTDKLGLPKLRQRPDEDDTTNFDHFAGVSFTWTDEGGEKTSQEPSFEFIELIAHEISGYTEVTDILLEDATINLINFLTMIFRKAYVWFCDRAFIRGSGARQPLGIRWDPAVQLVARQTAGAVTIQDIFNMDDALPSVFEEGAIWLMNKRCMNSLRNERDTNNALILQEHYIAPAAPVGAFGGTRIASLLGYPVVKADARCYPLGQTADVILCCPQWYFIGQRKAFTMDVSREYKFRENKTAIRVTGRIDGQCAIPEAFIILSLAGGGS